jgi:predicted RNA-binding Zn ribbon-like protein
MSEGQIQDDGYRFDLTGAHPTLDFANTLSRRADPKDSQEYLTSHGRLISWSEQTGVITHEEAASLRREAAAHPRAAAAALRRAIALREELFSLFAAIARGEAPPVKALDALNAALPEALGALRVGSERDGFRWRFEHDATDLTPMLAPVLRQAAELLTSPELVRVRECDAATCFWLFLDASKSGTRRWCDMKVCGNREKARRHHQRVRATEPGSTSRTARR